MTTIPERFISIGVHELPEEQIPKFKVGDLILIRPGSNRNSDGFYLKEGMGVITEICPFKVVGFETYKPQPIYVIEYKIRRTDRDHYCYVLEPSLCLPETEL